MPDTKCICCQEKKECSCVGPCCETGECCKNGTCCGNSSK